jgi:hypothetical protein
MEIKQPLIFWPVLLTAVFSFFSVAGFVLTYSQAPFIHEAGNSLYISAYIWSVVSVPVFLFFLAIRAPWKISAIPLASVVIGVPFAFLGMRLPVAYFTFGPGLDSSGISSTNVLGLLLHLGLAAYSVSVLRSKSILPA